MAFAIPPFYYIGGLIMKNTKKKYDRMNIPPSLKVDILKVIRNALPTNWEEVDTLFWISRLAEAKRYIMLKIRIAHDIEREQISEMERLEDKLYIECRDENVSVSERKRLAEARLGCSEEYRKVNDRLNKARSAIEMYEADLENVNDKTFAVRKVMDYIKVHMMYEVEE